MSTTLAQKAVIFSYSLHFVTKMEQPLNLCTIGEVPRSFHFTTKFICAVVLIPVQSPFTVIV